MQFRFAAPDDAYDIAKVQVSSWQGAYKNILPTAYLNALSMPPRETMWREAIFRGTPEVLIIGAEEALVGFIAYGPCRDDEALSNQAEIWALYLAPSHWSLGLGRRLWLRARERLIEQQYTSVSLWVLAANARAIRFYLAAGFVPEPLSSKESQIGGKAVREVRYVALLGS